MNSEYKYKVIVAYDGTHYNGWQIQTNGVAIQNVLQNTIQQITQTSTHITGAGRTDAGVHAKGQVAHFVVNNPLDLFRLKHSLNRLLPADIRVIDITEVPLNFHARYSATSKIYHYHLHLGPVNDPFQRHYRWHLRHPVNIELLRKAALYFIGTHDFTTFANDSVGGIARRDPVRTIYRLDVVLEEEGGVRLEFSGNGFLYKMVRNIVGTLVDAASGEIDLEEIPPLFAAKDREQAGRGAPAHGLFLIQVNY